MDPVVGLCYLRVPTWCPFRLQFYCNGHGWLAHKLKAKRIEHSLADNAFVRIENWHVAQKLADSCKPEQLHRLLDRYARQCCPVEQTFGQRYHWSIMQAEYSTDLVFRSPAALAPLYEQLSRESVLAVKAEQVATFLGKKITPQLAQEVGSRVATRIQGTCIKHRLGQAQVKMYDKVGLGASKVRRGFTARGWHFPWWAASAPTEGAAVAVEIATADRCALESSGVGSAGVDAPVPGVL